MRRGAQDPSGVHFAEESGGGCLATSDMRNLLVKRARPRRGGADKISWRRVQIGLAPRVRPAVNAEEATLRRIGSRWLRRSRH